MKEVIVHTCCACCIPYVRDTLEKEGKTVISLWYNPNIHPYEEYLKRRNALEKYSKETGLRVVYIDEYPLTTILERMATLTLKNPVDRCKFCYWTRLRRTAEYAKINGYEGFTTTLLVSPYQKHELIKVIGEILSKKYDVMFLYKDFREGYEISNKIIKELKIYRQNYCGCIFSEYEKYYLKIKNKI